MGRMQSSEIRRRFLEFFGERGHRLYPSASLIPHNDPTVLLTTGGVQQFIPYFLGQERPPSPRAMSAQKCFRTPDIEDVGERPVVDRFLLGNRHGLRAHAALADGYLASCNDDCGWL